MNANPAVPVVSTALALALAAGCGSKAPTDSARASGSVEATEVHVASQIAGRLIELRVAEGDRVAAGQPIAQIDTTDLLLLLRRAQAERDLAAAQLALLLAGSRQEDIRQSAAQVKSAEAEAAGARDDLAAAETDLSRFDSLLKSNSGTQKQRDDAAARRDLARSRLQAAEERVRGAREALTRLERGARPEEISAARARLAATEAQIASLEQNVKDATVASPVAGVVTQKLADAGEILAPRTPIVSVVDLDHAWANIYLDEPLIPRIRLGQPATIHTDAGGAGLAGTVTFISPKAEFTPRNVQTAEERSKLVYRLKVSVDNTAGVLKPGMPVEASLPLGAVPQAAK